MFKRTTSINKLLKLEKRKKVIQGGTSAGKTYAIIPIIIDWATKNERKRITIVAESIPAVKDGAVKIFKDIMFDTGRWVESRWKSNPMEYTFGTDTVVQFKSFDTVGKAKASGKRDVLFLNEANHISFEIADALMIRSKETWIDFNPDNEFWVHTEVLPEPNTDFIILTYKDNEACPPETLEDLNIKISKAFFDVNKNWKDPQNIKSLYWANWCKVYILGEIGSLQGVVFDNWQQVPSVPTDAKLLGFGMDFGFTNDPTTLVAVYKTNNQLYFDEVLYRTNMTNLDIGNFMKSENIGRPLEIVADSAEPKSIEELRRQGFLITPAKKGADSIKIGIDILKREPFFVTQKSINLIKELRSYVWATDRDGKLTGNPIDHSNHAIDALRYFALNKLNNRPSGKYATISI
jgi:phage terminase large subunit